MGTVNVLAEDLEQNLDYVMETDQGPESSRKHWETVPAA